MTTSIVTSSHDLVWAQINDVPDRLGCIIDSGCELTSIAKSFVDQHPDIVVHRHNLGERRYLQMMDNSSQERIGYIIVHLRISFETGLLPPVLLRQQMELVDMDDVVVIGAPLIHVLFPDGKHLLECIPKDENGQKSVRLRRLTTAPTVREREQVAARTQALTAPVSLVEIEASLRSTPNKKEEGVRLPLTGPALVRKQEESVSGGATYITDSDRREESRQRQSQGGRVEVLRGEHGHTMRRFVMKGTSGSATPTSSSSSSSSAGVTVEDEHEDMFTPTQAAQASKEEKKETPLEQIAEQERNILKMARRVVDTEFGRYGPPSSTSSSSSSTDRPSFVRAVDQRREQSAREEL
jgi:hypothetical protein